MLEFLSNDFLLGIMFVFWAMGEFWWLFLRKKDGRNNNTGN
jgi:hypothetical protein